MERPKIILLHIWIDRADYDSLVLRNALHIVEIGSGKSNRCKGVPATGFYRNPHIRSQLIMDSRDLTLARSDRHSGIRVNSLDLPIDALHHGFIVTRILGSHRNRVLRLLEYLDELLRSDVIAQRPQALSRAAG